MNPHFIDEFVAEGRAIFGDGFVPLHRPVFDGNERSYLVECIDSNFVSSVGARVDEFERHLAQFTGVAHAVATVNGTAALHIALRLAGVTPGCEVLTQALTFVATCNAIGYEQAVPVFVDVDLDTLGMSPKALADFFQSNCERREEGCWNRSTGRKVQACVPMHTFGHPCRIEEIVALCEQWGVVVIEDAAESLGSYVGARHTGSFGAIGTFSFNGNKVITTGGGGMLVSDDAALAQRAKYVTTTAKQPHPYHYVHDEIGFNYRLPNLNAALGCAQMESLPRYLAQKRLLAERYAAFFAARDIVFIGEREGTRANFWLNAILLDGAKDRDAFLEASNGAGLMTRPVWRLMNELPMFSHCQHDGLVNARWLQDRLVNIPSSVPDRLLPDSR